GGGEHVGVGAGGLLVDDGKVPGGVRGRFTEQAGREKSAMVRLALASALQRLEVGERWPLAEKLAAHAEDAGDPYLPLMTWYGVEPAVAADPARAAAL